MLPDWYFCCCIGAESEVTSAFLSILETLENRESSNQLLYTAYDELLRADPWMQIYALPRVLNSLPRRGAVGDREGVLFEYFEGLLGIMPQEVQPTFSALTHRLLQQDTSASAITGLMEACASKKMPPRELSRRPYLDLQEFLPETFLVSVLADRYAGDLAFVSEISAALEDETSQLRTLLHNALESRYGRLAFRLAAAHGRLVSSTYTQEDILTRVWTQEHSVALFEPDLLDTAARVLFLYDTVNPDQEQRVRICTTRILPEIWRLSHLRKYRRLIPEEKLKGGVTPFQAVKLIMDEERAVLLPVIYWQSVLWDLSSRVSPSATADEIAQTWQPPIPREMTIEVASNVSNETATWQKQLSALIRLLDSDKVKFADTINLTVKTKANVSFPTRFRWTVLTPWLWREPLGVRYSSAQKFEALVRLTATVPVVTRLLQELPPDSTQVVPVASMLVHAADVLTTALRYDERSHKADDARYKKYRFTSEQKGLIEFGVRQAKLVGTGRLESVPPDIFISLLPPAEQRSGKKVSGFNQSAIFINLVLPKIILEWISDAYPAAPMLDGPRRWIRSELIADIYALYRDHSEKEEDPEKVREALVARFLCTASQVVLDPDLDWRTAYYRVRDQGKIPKKWEVKGRQLLLTDHGLAPSEWLENRDGWEEPEDWSDNKYDPAALLVRSLERLASLQNDENDLALGKREQWRREWVRHLNKVSNKDHSDRYVRLRLLELIESEILRREYAEQEVISLFVLEYGSAYDLKLLFDFVFDLDRKPAASIVRKKLQGVLLGAMYAELERDAADVDYRRRRLTAQDPRFTANSLLKGRLIRKTLTRIAALHYFNPAEKSYRQWDQVLAELRQRSLNKAASNTLRRLKANVELHGAEKRLVLPEGEGEVAPWAIRGAVYDPNLMAMTLVYEDYDLGTVQYDLFKEPKLFDTKFRDRETCNVLAVLVTWKFSEEKHRTTYFFDCGLINYAPAHREGKEPLNLVPGDYVSLPIQRRRPSNSEYFNPYVPGTLKIERLPLRIKPGDVRMVTLQESWREDRNPQRTLTIRLGHQDITADSHVEAFDPDTSRFFCKQTDETPWQAFVTLGADRKWRPVDFTLFDLIARAFTGGRESSVVLTLIEERTTLTGGKTWLFSRRPGENYLLLREQFVEEDAQELEQEIAGMNKAYGLLVSVALTLRDDVVLLKLCRETPAEEKAQVNDRTRPRAPFDHRNAEWRNLFRKPNNPIATKADNRAWYYELEEEEAPAGYPPRIRVLWSYPKPDPDDHRIEFSHSGWKDQYPYAGYSERDVLPVVKGDALKPRELLVEDRSWSDFLAKWLELKVERLRINSVLGTVSPGYEGYIDCLTSENLRVRVEIESLTMEPLPVGGKPLMDGPREAEVIRRPEWRALHGPRPEIDPADIPPSAVMNGKCRGVVVGVPRRRGGSLCEVMWETDGEPYKWEVQVNNLSELKVFQGYKIEGRNTPAGWEFSFWQPDVRVRALWMFDDSALVPADMLYLGPTYDQDGREWALAEIAPGWLVELPRVPAGIRHLASGDGRNFENRLAPEQVLEDTSTSYKRRTDSFRRSVLFRDGKVLTGRSRSDLVGPGLMLNDVQVNPIQRGRDLYALEREFFLSMARPYISKREGPATQDTSRVWEEALEEYFLNPRDIPAVNLGKGEVLLQPGVQEVKVPSDDEPPLWTLRARLGPGEGPYVLDTNYSESVMVWLYRGADGVRASFRKVPPLTAEEYFEQLSVDVGKPKDIRKEKLYYVGGIKADASKGEEYEGLRHLFEMGYGKTLLVPEEQLQYNGGPFKQVDLVLAFGDAVAWITFEKKEVAETELIIININEADLQYSHGHSLYEQGINYSMIHPLHLAYDNGKVEIKYVEGLDKGQVEQEQPAFYRKVEARLDETSAGRLANRLREGESRMGRETVVLGRLDARRFRMTFGREVYFEHVRMSFEASTHGAPLKHGDRLFLKARNIRRAENEYFLLLSPPDYLSPEDIGGDLRNTKLELERRAFSVRENLLKRIMTHIVKHGGDGGLYGRLLLVRLNIDKQKDRIIPSLRPRAPFRKVSALAGAIKNEELLYGAVSNIGLNNDVQIELKPGIYIRLADRQIAYRPPDLENGAIVRIENEHEDQTGPDYSFRITYAAFSDAHYVPARTRLAVALPKNNLLNRWERERGDASSADFWQNRKGFTIGGLANISAAPATFDRVRNRWYPPQGQNFTELMKTEHPKIVRLGEAAHDQFCIDTMNGEPLLVGSLHVAEDNFNAKFVPLHAQPDDPRCRPLPWRSLTFADESVRRIIERAELEKWRYHDTETGTWQDDGDITLQRLKEHNAWTGPLFFERYGNFMRLRYGDGNFLTFGFPTEELISSLRERHPGGGSFHVAGVSKSGDGGLWIEIAPGRIAELPAHVVIWKSRSKVRSLAELNWEDFAPGDQVELELVADSPFMIDRVALKKWVPGPRKAFGPKRAFLPIQWADTRDGALTIGWGDYKLTYPIARPNPHWQEVILNADNELEVLRTTGQRSNSDAHHDGKAKLPVRGDVVLLSDASLLNYRNPRLLVALGLVGYKPQPAPDAAADFGSDPLLKDIITLGEAGLRTNSGRLRDLIGAAGGALPVTVERIDAETRTLFFSRRHQRAKVFLPVGRIGPSRVVGQLDYRTVLLRYAGKIVKVDIDEVVSGLREPFFQLAAEALQKSGTVVWLRGMEDGGVAVGLPVKRDGDLTVEAETALAREAGSSGEVAGLICRDTESMRLYWLPGTQAAWATLSREQLQSIFEDKGAFRVQLMDERQRSPYVSVIALPDARKAFSDLIVGKSVTVRVMKPHPSGAGEPPPCLVESYHTKVVLMCEPHGESLTEDVDVLMEVIRRNVEPQRLIVVAPRGTKSLKLDLPQWMLKNLPEGGQRRDELNNYLRWTREQPDLSHFYDTRLSEADDTTINRLLCYAYEDKRAASAEAFNFKINVAEQWEKRNTLSQEVFVPYAIMAILLFDKIGTEIIELPSHSLPHANSDNLRAWASEWRNQASRLTQQLGARALRSSHVEVLTRKWLLNVDSQKKAYDLWGRLQVIQGHLARLETQRIIEIRQFCNAVELRNQESLLPISQGLFASLGELPDIPSLLMFAEQTNELIKLCRTLPVSKRQVWLRPTHKEGLRKILWSIKRDALDLIVLDPIPSAKNLDGNSKE